MAWKVEKWLEEVFPGEERLYSEYQHLTDREFAIVVAGVLDAALAELISKRVVDLPRECEAFLGLDESGGAPAGSMGARIQLAVLLGIIRVEDARILRTIKNIRNRFAHRVNIDFLHESVCPLVRALYSHWSDRSQFILRSQPEHVRAHAAERLQEIARRIDIEKEAAEGLLLAVFVVYQAYFFRLSERIERIDYVVGSRPTAAEQPDEPDAE